MEHEGMLDNKKYISSRDAARLTDYAQDYIGQLCRGGKVLSQRVGRSWFVEKESLLAYVEQQKIEKQKMSMDLKRTQKKAVADYKKTHIEPTTKAKTVQRPIDEEVFVNNSTLIPVVGLLLLLAVVGFSLLLDNGVVKRSNLASAVSPYNGIRDATNPQVASGKEAEADIIKKDNLDIASELHSGIGLLRDSIETVALMTHNLPKGARIAFERTGTIPEGVSNPAKREGKGLVVMPSMGEDADNEMVEYIKSSFSDEVIITPDEGGESGIIQPVFRESVGRDYLYVVVPIRE